MIIYISIIFIFICILLFIKYLYRYYKTKMLYKSFYLDKRDTEEEITKEYFKKIKNPDINEGVYNDLELDQIFNIVNRTYSDVGKEYMYGQMFISNHCHKDLENIIEKLKNEKLLKKVLYELYSLSRGYTPSLQFFEQDNMFTQRDTIIIFLSTLILSSLILSCFFDIMMVKYVVLWLMIQVGLYTHYVKKTDDMMSQCMSYSFVVECLKSLQRFHLFSTEESKKIYKMINRANRYTLVSRVIGILSQIDIFYLMEFIKGIFFLPIYQCYFLLKHKNELGEDFLEMYEYVGKVETAVSILSLRHQYQTCIPEVSSVPIVQFKNCYHPIIKNPVKNSFSTDTSCMITGSNASGKSTFLKTVGINMIMAKAYHTCFADEFVYYPFQLYTSIHIQDNLKTGESYYIREIKTLKTILNMMSTHQCLILIDEILRGTNEKERIAISKVVLKYMFESQSLIFVTTHDLSIVDAFSNISQYCFNDDIVDKIWKSDYKIKAGVCKVGNAIKLLEVYGFDSKIVEQLKKPY